MTVYVPAGLAKLLVYVVNVVLATLVTNAEAPLRSIWMRGAPLHCVPLALIRTPVTAAER